MSELQDYLNSMSSDITDDVAVSERFVDKRGIYWNSKLNQWVMMIMNPQEFRQP